MIPQNLPTCFNQVYYVESSLGENSINPVAINPKVTQTDVEWMDTSRGKIIHYKKIIIKDPGIDKNGCPRVFEVLAEDGRRYTFTKLILDIYNEKVKHQVMLSPEFDSDEELQRFYQTTDFENG